MAAVMPFRAEPPSRLADLVDQLLHAKRREASAIAERVEIEQQILALYPAKEEGSETIKLDSGMRLCITAKLTYSADMQQLAQLAEGLPADLRPIKTETKLDSTGAKWLRANRPDLWSVIAPAITVKPAKPAVEVKA